MSTKIELNKRDQKKLVKNYTSGMPLAEVADAWGMGIQTVRRLLVDAGVEIRPRGRQPQS